MELAGEWGRTLECLTNLPRKSRKVPLCFLHEGEWGMEQATLREMEEEDPLWRFPFLETLHYITLTLHYGALRTLTPCGISLLLGKTISCLLMIAGCHEKLL